MLRLEDEFPAVGGAPVDKPVDPLDDAEQSPQVESDSFGMRLTHSENDKQKGVGLRL